MWPAQLARVPQLCIPLSLQSWAQPHTLCRGCIRALRQDRQASRSPLRGFKVVAQAVAAPEVAKAIYADGRVQKVCCLPQKSGQLASERHDGLEYTSIILRYSSLFSFTGGARPNTQLFYHSAYRSR